MITADKDTIIKTINVITINWSGNSGTIGDEETVAVGEGVAVGLVVAVDFGVEVCVGANVGVVWVGAGVGEGARATVAVLNHRYLPPKRRRSRAPRLGQEPPPCVQCRLAKLYRLHEISVPSANANFANLQQNKSLEQASIIAQSFDNGSLMQG